MDLHDAWQGGRNRPGYTYYLISGAARLDRIYILSVLLRRKQGMETLAAAFTDHIAVCLRLSVVEPIMRRDSGYWKMDARILEDKTVVEQFKILWDQLRRQKHVFPNTPIWWERSCKRRIQGFFRKVQAERMRDHRAMENYYYECIYEKLQQTAHNADTRTVLQKLKAKTVRLHKIRLNQLLIDNNTAERIEGEQPTMYNVLNMRRRRNKRTITALRDQDGITQTTPRGIAPTLVTYMAEKYKQIEVNTENVQKLLREIETDQNNQYNEAPAARFTQGEIEEAIHAGGRKKAPGRDGLSSEFYKQIWEITK
jgi:hypothetical protein